MPAPLLFIPIILSLTACDRDEAAAPIPPAVETEEEKQLYALGQAVARQFVLPGLFEEDEMAIVSVGFKDAVARRDTLVNFDAQVEPMNAMLTARRAVKNLQWGIEFREMAATWPGAITTDSGLIFQSVEKGTGASPTADDTVAAHFNGKFVDGRMFDSSADEGVANFALNQVMPGWTEAFQMMKAGGKARFVVPPHLAHGEQGKAPTIPPNATLIFEVELLAIQ